MDTVDILGVPIAAVNMKGAVDRVEEWIRRDVRTFVTVTGVHGIIASHDDPELLRIHNAAGMCVPDGTPTVWVGRACGHADMDRVYGPDLMLEVMKVSVARGYTHFFYGGRKGVPGKLKDRMLKRFPALRVVGMLSPPFRPMSPVEEENLRRRIDRLSPDVLWVGLSTPKQERWMAAHLGRLRAKVMIGVGAAFDIHAGLLRQAPRWMQRAGLEWFFRLCVEPRRLWRRYLFNNPRFAYLMLRRFLNLGRKAEHTT